MNVRLTELIFSQAAAAEVSRQALQVLVVLEMGLSQAPQEQVMAVAAEADRRCSRQVKTAVLLVWLEMPPWRLILALAAAAAGWLLLQPPGVVEAALVYL